MAVISSQSPDREPRRCPVCGRTAQLEPPAPGEAACCPACREIVSWFRQWSSRAAKPIGLDDPFLEAGFESLDLVEFGMAFEDRFGDVIADEDFRGIRTVRDLIRMVRDRETGAGR